MGLDIYFHIAKRNEVEKVKERLAELEKALHEEYSKEEYNEEKVGELNAEYEEINPWEEVAYFRKVNFLLPFFNYEENCSDIEISKDKVENLIESCSEVLEDNDKADDLLHTECGFFFGSTDYNDVYFDDVREVKDKFESILKEYDLNEYILTMHCWW